MVLVALCPALHHLGIVDGKSIGINLEQSGGMAGGHPGSCGFGKFLYSSLLLCLCKLPGSNFTLAEI